MTLGRNCMRLLPLYKGESNSFDPLCKIHGFKVRPVHNRTSRSGRRFAALLLFGEEDGDFGVDLVFGAHFAVLIEERHFDDGIEVTVLQSVMIEQAA